MYFIVSWGMCHSFMGCIFIVSWEKKLEYLRFHSFVGHAILQ